jgi:integrase
MQGAYARGAELGTKTYFLRYQNQRGERKQLKLGRTTDLSVTQARKLVQHKLGLVAMGRDPLEELRTMRQVPTLREFAQNRYLAYVKTYKKSWWLDETLLRVHILPKLGHKRLDQITREDISGLQLERLEAGAAPASADRLVILLRYIYNLAIKWNTPGVRENPTKDVVLFNVNNNRERFLSSEELQNLAESVKQSENPLLEPIILMLVLTGARKRELLDAKWEDFDLERRSWRIPITKSGRPRTVPLSDAAWRCWPGCRESKGASMPLPTHEQRSRLYRFFRPGMQPGSGLGWKMYAFMICVTLLQAF